MFHVVGDRRVHSVSFGSGPGMLVGIASPLEAGYGVDLRPRLGELSVPALVVHGVLDALSPAALADAHALAALIPDARLELLDGAGHLPLLSQPGEVAALLGDFLAAVPGGERPVGEPVA